MNRTPAVLIVFCLTLCGSSMLRAAGEEDFGNAPLNDLNYSVPGIMPVVNHASRVYHQWVNGNEWFYYRGDSAALNDALRKFAGITAKSHEVLLRPAPGIASTFQIANTFQTVAYDWNLHLVGGIAGHMTTLELGGKVWNESPMMTVYVGGDIKLEKIEIPKSVTILELSDLARRYREALASKDVTVRGWTAVQLAQLNPYDAESLAAIAKLLKDNDNWVRQNATLALGAFGKKAESALPLLREALNSSDKQLAADIRKTIAAIEQGRDTALAEQNQAAALQAISEFRKGR